jgi:hypothetical protein
LRGYNAAKSPGIARRSVRCFGGRVASAPVSGVETQRLRQAATRKSDATNAMRQTALAKHEEDDDGLDYVGQDT